MFSAAFMGSSQSREARNLSINECCIRISSILLALPMESMSILYQAEIFSSAPNLMLGPNNSSVLAEF